jgi:hypothetical protein
MPVERVPDLADVAEDLGALDGLSRAGILHVLRSARHLVTEIEHKLALATPEPAPPAAPDDAGEVMLTPSEAAKVLGVSQRWLKRRGAKLPGRVQLSPRRIVYRRGDLLRYLQRRATR